MSLIIFHRALWQRSVNQVNTWGEETILDGSLTGGWWGLAVVVSQGRVAGDSVWSRVFSIPWGSAEAGWDTPVHGSHLVLLPQTSRVLDVNSVLGKPEGNSRGQRGGREQERVMLWKSGSTLGWCCMRKPCSYKQTRHTREWASALLQHLPSFTPVKLD